MFMHSNVLRMVRACFAVQIFMNYAKWEKTKEKKNHIKRQNRLFVLSLSHNGHLIYRSTSCLSHDNNKNLDNQSGKGSCQYARRTD